MIVGIDLGTSTSEVAYLDKNGNVTVIPNKDGELITPSVIHIKHNGRAVVGAEAREFLYTRPECTFMEVKRDFGRDVTLTAHGKTYAPEEIQSSLISYLVDCAEQFTGEDVTGAIITVPAYFNDVQRKQTIRAGELANLRVERIINEPTAAALDYGLHNLDKTEHILVYDFGGGTLDVTLLELFEGVIDVKASCGNSRLGGKDFDAALMEYIAGRDYKKIMADPGARMKLKREAEACKIALTADESAKVLLPLITENLSLVRTVTRREFEKLINEMVASTGEQIDTALRDAGIAPREIDRVILVGGSTRIPLVRKFVEEKLGIVPQDYDATGAGTGPELMVVRGAAIQSGIVEKRIPEEKSVILTDICPFTLGLMVISEEGVVVDPLIKKNVTIPHDYSKIYSALYEYQQSIELRIYQGESKIPQENVLIGRVTLDNLQRKRDEKAKAEVTYSYDASGVLHVKARAIGNDSTVEADIDINNNPMQKRPAVILSEWEKAEGASRCRPIIRKAEKLINKHVGEDTFVEMGMQGIQMLVNDLKADLILGNTEAVDEALEEIKAYFNLVDMIK